MFLPLMVTSQGQMDGSNQRKVGNHVSFVIFIVFVCDRYIRLSYPIARFCYSVVFTHLSTSVCLYIMVHFLLSRTYFRPLEALAYSAF